MTQHLPALLFCIPLLTAISMPMVGLRHRAWCRPMALVAAWAMSVTAVVNLVVVLSSGEIRYAFGGWAPPIGIEWVADGLASVMMVAISLIASICLIYGGTVSPLPAGGRVVLYYTLILLLLSGLTGSRLRRRTCSTCLFFWKWSHCPSAALVGIAGGKALVFAFRYLILASIGATFYLLGVSFFYAATGTLNMADLAQRVPALLDSKAVIGGLVFMFIGLGIKMALMPLHGWLPDAYSYAPDAVSPLLSALVTKVSLLVWARILYWAVGAGSELETTQILRLVWVSGALAVRCGRVSGTDPTGCEADVRLWGLIAHRPDSHRRGSGKPNGIGRGHVLPDQRCRDASNALCRGWRCNSPVRSTDHGGTGRIAWASALDHRGDNHRGHVDDRHPANGRVFREVVYHSGRPSER